MRNRQVVAVLAVVIGLVAAFVVIANLVGEDSPSVASTAPSTSSTTTATTPAAPAPGCTPAPKVPGTTAQLDAPDAAQIKAVEGKSVEATLTTNCGDLVLTLDGAKAPTTVASFAQLARNGYWTDAPCSRLVMSGIFILQCGDPTGTQQGDPGYGFGLENAPADGKFPRGSVAMARRNGDPNSNGGQFFLVVQDTVLPTTDGGYSLFGTVTSGMDIVDRIAAGGNGTDGVTPKLPISFLSVTTQTKD